MMPEEHLAHATAVKLMEEKDYFVQIYIEALRHTLGTLSFESKQNDKKEISICVHGSMRGIRAAIEGAEQIAYEAMKPIQNYGKKK